VSSKHVNMASSSTVKKSFRCAICGATHQQSRGPICPNLKCDLPIFTDFLRRFDARAEMFTDNNSAAVRRVFAFLHENSDSYAEWARTNPDASMPPESLRATTMSSFVRDDSRTTSFVRDDSRTPTTSLRINEEEGARTTTTTTHDQKKRPCLPFPLPTPPPTVVQAFRFPTSSSSIGASGEGGGATSLTLSSEPVKGPAPAVLNCELLCRARKVERVVLDPKDFRF
jgi:hypothetical protein